MEKINLLTSPIKFLEETEEKETHQDAVIKTEGLEKFFKTGLSGKQIMALKGINLNIYRGEIFGFLGPNGAGKTTTIKILMGLIFPTRGKAWILGKELGDIETKKRLGFLPEHPYFYEYLKGWEFLEFYGQLFELKGKVLKERIEYLLDLVGLSHAAYLPLRKYSKGMLQRIGIAQALINDPELIILDEPMSGLDPVGRKEIRDLILELNRTGKTIFFSSHIIPDVEMICNRVGILLKGELVSTGKLDEIIEGGIRYIDIIAQDVEMEILEHIRSMGFQVMESGSRISIRLQDEKYIDSILNLIISHRGHIISVMPHRESLEEHFIRRIGER